MKSYLSIAAVLILAAFPATGQPRGSTVVFDCLHGAAKSVIAAAYFNKMLADPLPPRVVAKKKHSEWNQVRDVNKDYAAARDTVVGLVTKLLESMAPAMRP